MNIQNNFLTRTRQLTRNCSYCKNSGHNVTHCNDPTLLNFQTILINRRDNLREVHSIDINNKILYFQTWLYGQSLHLIKSYAMRFCGAYSRNNLQVCVSKIISLIWNVQPDIWSNILPMNNYIPLPSVNTMDIPLQSVSIMDIPDDSFNYLDLRLVELFADLRNNLEVSNENSKFEINIVLCVELTENEIKKECNICYEEKLIRDMVTLNCNHKFCGVCISQTLKKCCKFKLPNCAMCRTKIDCILVNNNEIMNTLKENIV